MTTYYHTNTGPDSEDVLAIKLKDAFSEGIAAGVIPKGYWLVVHQKTGYQRWLNPKCFEQLYVAKSRETACAAEPEPEKPAYKFKPVSKSLVILPRNPGDVDPALVGYGAEYRLGEVLDSSFALAGRDFVYPKGTLVAFTGTSIQIEGRPDFTACRPQVIQADQIIGVFQPQTPAQTA